MCGGPRGWSRQKPFLCIGFALMSCSDPVGIRSGVHDRWSQSQQAASFSRPATLANVVFFGTGDGKIVARSSSTGAALWTADAGAPVLGGRLIARNGVVVGSTMQSTVGINAASGAVLWSYNAPLDTVGGNNLPGQVILNRIDADDQMVFVPAWGASISALDLQTGTVRWIWQPGRASTDTASSGIFRSGASGVRVSGDTVYATVWHFLRAPGVPAEIWVVALDRSSGQELWRVTLPCYWSAACIDGAPAVYGSLVIINQGAHEYAIDTRTQHIAWDFPTSPVVTAVSESELFGDVVYHDGGDHNIYALRASDGSLVWKASIPGAASEDLLITDKRVIFPDGSFLYAIDRATGKLVLQMETRGGLNAPVTSPSAAMAGQVFVNLYGAAWSFDVP